MGIDTISTDRLPACPSCGGLMKFARSLENFGARPALRTFECRQCCVAVTAEEALDVLELAGPV